MNELADELAEGRLWLSPARPQLFSVQITVGISKSQGVPLPDAGQVVAALPFGGKLAEEALEGGGLLRVLG